MPATLFFVASLFFILGTLAPLNKIFFLSLLLGFFFRQRKFILLALLTFAAGYFYFLWRTTPTTIPLQSVSTQMQTETDYTQTNADSFPRQSAFNQRQSTFQLEIISEPKTYENYQSFIGQTNKNKLLAYAPNFYQLQFGDLIEAEGSLSQLQAKKYRLNQIYFSLSVKKLAKVGQVDSLPRRVFAFKAWLEKKLAQALPLHSFEIIAGLLYGRHIQTAALRESFKQAGLSHLTAMSGYNLTIITSAVYSGLRFFLLPNVLLNLIAILLISLFVIFTGAQGSIVRAFLMSLVLIIIKSQGRIPLARNVLLAAALLITLANPTNLSFDLGFQLSFLATIGIIYLAPRLEEKLRTASTTQTNFHFLRKILSETVAAQLLVLPLIWYYFGEFNLFSVFTNLIVLPWLPFLMAVGATATALLPLPLIPLILTYPFQLLALLLQLFGQLPMVYFNPPVEFIIVIYLGLAYWLYHLNKKRLLDFAKLT